MSAVCQGKNYTVLHATCLVYIAQQKRKGTSGNCSQILVGNARALTEPIGLQGMTLAHISTCLVTQLGVSSRRSYSALLYNSPKMSEA